MWESFLTRGRNILGAEQQFPLLDPETPNLYREYFPYTEIPDTPFHGRMVPLNPAREIWITDTTFRDGQQARPPYSAKQIVDIFDLLHRMGGPKGVIRQCEFFLYSDKDKEAVRLCLERGYRFPEVTGWIRAVKSDFQLVKDMGLKETGILTSCSDYHIHLKLGKTRKQALDDYLDIVRTALEHGIIPRCHLEDITRADFFGFVIPFVRELMKLSAESGIPVKVRACDTMGYGVPYQGAALPRSVPELIFGLNNYGGVPSEQLEWHGHNDFHKVLINASTAWLYGCSSANGALLGFGERTGNTPVEALLIEYISLTGDSEGIDTAAITDMANYFRHNMGVHIPSNYPFVGHDFNNTSAGIHADGVLKNEEIYNIFDTDKILKRPLGVTITDKSGVAGIAHWVNSNLEIKGGRKIDKRHPGIAKIYKWVMEQYEGGRTTNISPDEMLEKAKKHLPECFVSDLDKLKERAREIALHLIEEVSEKPEMHTTDPAVMEPMLQKLVDENPFIQFAYVIDTEGNKITRNITQPVFRAKYEHFGVGENFSERRWFIKPMEDGMSYVTDFYTSKITDVLCITVSTPIRNYQEQIVGVLGIDIKFEDLVRAE